MTTTARELDIERYLTDQAGQAVNADPDHLAALNSFAEQRSGDTPVTDLETRDFRRETLEELADARNYLVWCWQQASARGDGGACSLALGALAGVISAWAQVIQLPPMRSVDDH